MIEPTREQLAKIDQLADLYDSVECQLRIAGKWATEEITEQGFGPITVTRNVAEIVDVTCWHYRTSGAKIVAHALTIHPDGTESDRR